MRPDHTDHGKHKGHDKHPIKEVPVQALDEEQTLSGPHAPPPPPPSDGGE